MACLLLSGPKAKPADWAIASHATKTRVLPQVLNGVDVLAEEGFAPIRHLRIGLITNHTGTDSARNSTINLLHDAPDVQLEVLFSPEHGLRGQRDERVPDGFDEQTGLPVYSLYGDRHAPTTEQMHGLDALVFDIQDVGCRFYTYISTMGHCLEAAARAHVRFVVLDRVNPITGRAVEGPIRAGKSSFTAFHDIPVRHGMTVGELALMFNAECGWGADLVVVPIHGWDRGCWYDETGLPWTNPSPNMRSLTEAILYPGIGLLEFTNVSVGRGTGTPFEVVGAPYIHDVGLASALNQLGLPGARFVPVRFTPTASVFKDQACGGVSILLTDRVACPVVEMGVAIAQTLHRLYPSQFQLDKFDKLLAHPATMDALREGRTSSDIQQAWLPELEQFRKRREAFLLYR